MVILSWKTAMKRLPCMWFHRSLLLFGRDDVPSVSPYTQSFLHKLSSQSNLHFHTEDYPTACNRCWYRPGRTAFLVFRMRCVFLRVQAYDAMVRRKVVGSIEYLHPRMNTSLGSPTWLAAQYQSELTCWPIGYSSSQAVKDLSKCHEVIRQFRQITCIWFDRKQLYLLRWSCWAHKCPRLLHLLASHILLVGSSTFRRKFPGEMLLHSGWLYRMVLLTTRTWYIRRSSTIK